MLHKSKKMTVGFFAHILWKNVPECVGKFTKFWLGGRRTGGAKHSTTSLKFVFPSPPIVWYMKASDLGNYLHFHIPSSRRVPPDNRFHQTMVEDWYNCDISNVFQNHTRSYRLTNLSTEWNHRLLQEKTLASEASPFCYEWWTADKINLLSIKACGKMKLNYTSSVFTFRF